MDQLATIRVEAPVRVDSSLCSRYRCSKSNCADCARVCPVPGAVRLGDEGAEITPACLGCGACASACPNGALQLLEDDGQLSRRIRERVQIQAVFRIACSRAEGRADLVLPCLSRLTESLLLEPLREGAPRVELATPDCTACGFQKAAPQWMKVALLASALCETAGLGTERVKRLQVPSGQPKEAAAVAQKPRRAMFRAMAERWQATGETVAAPAEAPEALPFRELIQRHGANPKRSALLQVLAELPGMQPGSKMMPASAVPLARLEVDRRCVGCNVCTTLCPVGAIRYREEAGQYTLELNAARCTGCRVCESACFHRAIHLRETVDLGQLFASDHVTLFTAPRRTCRTCRESFVGDSSEFCPTCRISTDRREGIARHLFMGGTQNDQC